MRFPRSAGILLHPTSLPGRFGIGELGAPAFEFIDDLAQSGQSLWQILPLGPTGYGDSPYACFSALAGNPLLIDLAQLEEEGDVSAEELAEAPDFPKTHVDFGSVISFKTAILQRAARAFRSGAEGTRQRAFEQFCLANRDWLDDFALFMALKDAHGGTAWHTWEQELAARDPETLTAWRERLDEQVYAHRYYQFQFFRQWTAIKSYANQKGIQIIGDIPIFVAYDSVDVWAHPDLFYLDENKLPTRVAGVPPDYFSPTGQLWGNPIYDWGRLAEKDYTWWIRRFEQTFETVDIVRLDHFRGFAAYWAIPAGEPTAIHGTWEPGPGAAFFQTIKDALGELPIIAEDLGHITDDVLELREQFDLPGMNVLQFAFTSDAGNPYLPHNVVYNSVIYTGTHDNDTTVGWHDSREEEELAKYEGYVGPTTEPVNWAMMRLAYRSVSDLAIVPMQDVLGLDSDARMNTPGQFGNNWIWRLEANQFSEDLQNKLRELALTYGRAVAEEQQARPEWM